MSIFIGLDSLYSMKVWIIYFYGYFYAVILSHIPVKYSVERLRQISVTDYSNQKQKPVPKQTSSSFLDKHDKLLVRIKGLLKSFLAKLRPEDDSDVKRSDIVTAAVIGYIERVLYITIILRTSSQFNSAQLIGFWLTAKVASQWGNIWNRKNKLEDKKKLEESSSHIISGDDANISNKYIIYGDDDYNIYLIGCLLSLIYSIIGAVSIQESISSGYGFFIITMLVSLFLLFVPHIAWEFHFSKKLSAIL
jgi:hypothetical protein